MLPAAQTRRESVVITGCGWVTPFATGDIDYVLTAARTQRSSTPPPCWLVPDDVPATTPALSKEIKKDKAALMSAVALTLACRDASLAIDTLQPERSGMALGCALAGQQGMVEFANEVRTQSPRFVSPIHFPQTVGNYVAGALSRAYQLRGPNTTIACGVASGLHALHVGRSLVEAGKADVMIAGGVERLSDDLARAFAGHQGGLSEGACLFVLESEAHALARGGRALAYITGAGQRSPEEYPGPSTECTVLSVAGLTLPNAIVIEYWTGRCLAALGAAAVAAAIGAAHGKVVPHTSRIDPSSISSSSARDAADRHGPEKHVEAVVLAGMCQAHLTVPTLAVTGTHG